MFKKILSQFLIKVILIEHILNYFVNFTKKFFSYLKKKYNLIYLIAIHCVIPLYLTACNKAVPISCYRFHFNKKLILLSIFFNFYGSGK